MVKSPKNDLKLRFTNFLGALGYFFCSLQWLWSILLYFSLINAAVLFISPNADRPVPAPTPSPTPVNTSPLFLIVAAIIIILTVALTIYTIYKVPSTLTKAANKVVNVASGNVTHTVIRVQHIKDTQKTRRKLTPVIIAALKAVLIIIPLAFAIASKLLDKQILDYNIAIFASLWLAGFSATAFTLQYLLAKIFNIKSPLLH